MALSISNIVNVQLNTVPKGAAVRDFGTVALFTPENPEAFGNGLYLYVNDLKEVMALFGTNSETAKAATAFFAQQPRAKQLLLAKIQSKTILGEDDEQPTIELESPVEAMLSLDEVNNGWYGVAFVGDLTDDDIINAAEYAQANSKLLAVTTNNPEQLENNTSSVFRRIKDASLDHVLALYDPNDKYAVISAISRLLSMNFSANNSTITLKFKTLPAITADEITATQAKKAQVLGVNIYTYFDDVALLAEGTVVGGKFADEIVILDWFKDAVQKAVFNRLYQSPTKLPLTDRGQAVLIAAVEKVCIAGVNNGAFAAGQWNGDSFGTLETGDMLESGYYVWAAPMDTLSESDREIRKATPIQVAVKLAGAIHSSDVIINFNR